LLEPNLTKFLTPQVSDC